MNDAQPRDGSSPRRDGGAHPAARGNRGGLPLRAPDRHVRDRDAERGARRELGASAGALPTRHADSADGPRRASRRDLASPARTRARAAAGDASAFVAGVGYGQAARAAPASAGGRTFRPGPSWSAQTSSKQRCAATGGQRSACSRTTATTAAGRGSRSPLLLPLTPGGDEAACPGCAHGVRRRGLSLRRRSACAGSCRRSKPRRGPLAESLSGPRADHRLGARLRLRAGAGVQPRRPRPPRRRPALDACCASIATRASSATGSPKPSSIPSALARTSSSDSGARWATASVSRS